MHKVTALTLLAGCVILAGATHAIADGCSPKVAQVVALDECDPDSFNAALARIIHARQREEATVPLQVC